MSDLTRSERPRSPATTTPAPPAQATRGTDQNGPAASPLSKGPTPAQALALQRSAGNRAAGRALARWAAHPDKAKKGQLMTDEMAAEFSRFNPPLSK